MSKEEDIAIVGKVFSGGTAIFNRLVYGAFFEEYDNSLDDSCRKKFDVDGESYVVDFVETNDEEYSALRHQYIRTGDGFLVVYSITDRSSFEYAKSQIEEVYKIKDVDEFPLVLVGNKCDLEYKRQVSTEEGFALAESHGIPFFETSAKTSVNVNEAIEALIRRCEGKKEPESNDNNNDARDKKCIIQ